MHRTSPQVTGYGAMTGLARVMIIAVLCLAPRSAQAVSCVFADKGYSAGARACFCPKLEKKVGSYQIVQERWAGGDVGKVQPTDISTKPTRNQFMQY